MKLPPAVPIPRFLKLAALLAGLLCPVVQAQGSLPAFQIGYSSNSEQRAPLLVKFKATVPAGYQVAWDFGDGTQASGPLIEHTYYRAGTYSIRANLLDAQGKVVSYARGQIKVKDGGAENAQLTILLGRGQVRLSAVDSVLYTPNKPKLLLDGKEVPEAALPLRDGAHQAAAQGVLQDGRGIVRRINFTTAPLGGSLAFEAEVLRLTNRARARGWNCTTLREGGPALPPLTQNSVLDVAALAQSAGMALYGYFDHKSGLDGSDPMRRVHAAGMQPGASAENIAAGQVTPAEVVDGWLRSPGHCHNIMGDFTLIGLSYVNRPGTTLTHYWTQVFAKP